jgi:hypothetical protein
LGKGETDPIKENAPILLDKPEIIIGKVESATIIRNGCRVIGTITDPNGIYRIKYMGFTRTVIRDHSTPKSRLILMHGDATIAILPVDAIIILLAPICLPRIRMPYWLPLDLIRFVYRFF